MTGDSLVYRLEFYSILPATFFSRRRFLDQRQNTALLRLQTRSSSVVRLRASKNSHDAWLLTFNEKDAANMLRIYFSIANYTTISLFYRLLGRGFRS